MTERYKELEPLLNTRVYGYGKFSKLDTDKLTEDRFICLSDIHIQDKVIDHLWIPVSKSIIELLRLNVTSYKKRK